MKLLKEETVFIRAFDPNCNNHTDPSDSMTKAMRDSTNTFISFSDFSKYCALTSLTVFQKISTFI
jgi:hypothetical protein